MNPSATPSWPFTRIAATVGVALLLAGLALLAPPTAQASGLMSPVDDGGAPAVLAAPSAGSAPAVSLTTGVLRRAQAARHLSA